MSLFNKESIQQRRVRSEMEEASGVNKSEAFEQSLLEQTGDAKYAKTYRTRGRIYDKLHVSLRTMDIIIATVSILIVAALIIGIIIGP